MPSAGDAFSTQEAAVQALKAELRGADHDVEYGRVLCRVAGRCRFEHRTTWDAFRRSAEELFKPVFNGSAKATVWTLLDPFFGKGPDAPVEQVRTGVLERVVTLRQLQEDPNMARSPEAVVPRLAWEHRVTLLAAREKAGKSTLASAAIAAASGGGWMFGMRLTPGKVLLIALEEYEGDVARRLCRFGAEPSRVFILPSVEDPLGDLQTAVEALEPVLVVIDTLPAFVESIAPESGSAASWTPIMNGIARCAHDSGSAIILLHHADKATNSYRDSTAIGAGVDVILEMKLGSDPSIRLVSSRGRFRVDEFSWRLIENGQQSHVELSTGELSLDARVLLYIETHPRRSSNAIRQGVEGKHRDIDSAVRRLEARGAIENVGSQSRHEWLAVRVPESSQGRTSDEVGTKLGRDAEADPAESASSEGFPPVGGDPRTRPPKPFGAEESPPQIIVGSDATAEQRGVEHVCPGCDGGMGDDDLLCETCQYAAD